MEEFCSSLVVIKTGSHMRVGDGHSIIVWDTAWLPSLENEYMT